MTNNHEPNHDILLEMRDIRIDGFSDEQWHPIIKGVDLTLRRGEIMGLIGESGAGKSTLGKAAMGYTQPGCKLTGGSILFDGIDLAKASDREKRRLWGTRIAYVAQSAAASFNPAHRLIDQTVEAANRRGIRPDAESRADAVELFRALQLPDPETIGSRYPHQVSGGQLQRVMTAMAMSPRPDLIIFDEPTTALDVTTQVEVLSAMRNIVEEFNTAAIYITHDLAVVAQMADFIKVLRYGEEVEQAPTRKMLTQPEQPYTKSLWSVRALEKPEVKGEDIVLFDQPRRCCLRPGQGIARRQHFDPSRANRCGGRRIRLRQIDNCTGDYRTAAAIGGRSVFNGEPLARGTQGPQQGATAEDPDDLPDGGHGHEPAPDRRGHHRATARILSRAHRQGARRKSDQTAGDDRTRRQFHGPAAFGTVRRAETAHLHCPSACRKPGSHHLRRSHLRARPDRPGRHSATSVAAAEAVQHHLPLHHP
jgi:ABC-type dipeptide/oligopeptide/nickel transport system ATPase component